MSHPSLASSTRALARSGVSILLVAAFASCAGPEGPKGDPGEPGPAGPPGSPGATGGDADGGGGPSADGALFAYGDGSAGELVVSTNQDWSATPAPEVTQNVQFTDVRVAAGATLVLPSGVVIRCRGTFANDGKIVVRPGARPGNGPFYAPNLGITWTGTTPAGRGVALAPASTGDLGDASNTRAGGKGGVGLGELQARQLLRPGPLGGGAGANSIITRPSGDLGGGTLTIACAGAVTNAASGEISADARPAGPISGGAGGAGGGGGGVILLASKTSVTNAGTISANGSDGMESSTNDGPGGGGGGGIVHMLAPAVTAGTVVVKGGAAGAGGRVLFSPGDRAGGGGGGACGGNGGAGGNAGVSAPGAAQAGEDGYVLESTVDPTSLL